MKDTLQLEFLRRGKPVLKFQFSGKNEKGVLNVFAIRLLTYAFRILPGMKAPLENVQEQIRTYHHNLAMEPMTLLLLQVVGKLLLHASL